MERSRKRWREGDLMWFPGLMDEEGSESAGSIKSESDECEWWNLDHKRWYLTWHGKTCELSEYQGVLLQLLAMFQGQPVEYVEISIACMDDLVASGDSIRHLKHRLVEALNKGGMDDLAAAIVTRKGERMSLELPGEPRLFFRCVGVPNSLSLTDEERRGIRDGSSTDGPVCLDH